VQVASYVPFSESICDFWHHIKSTLKRNRNDPSVYNHPLEVEISSFCREVIQARVEDGLADPGIILDDVTKVTAGDLGSDLQGFLAGFPCQAG